MLCPAGAGVLTKLDIMDKGTDASAMMRNQIVPLRLGYIGMVNRSQMDINMKRSIRDAGAAEAAFFETHPEYQEVCLSPSPACTGAGCTPGKGSFLALRGAISHFVSVEKSGISGRCHTGGVMAGCLVYSLAWWQLSARSTRC